jgi:hypothetical protein
MKKFQSLDVGALVLWRAFGLTETSQTFRGQNIIYVQTYFDQLFRGHKKQFSDQFLELDNE